MKICFVIPTYNDEANFKKLYVKIKKKFPSNDNNLYFVVINDGSDDKFEYLKSISNLRLINLKINVGSQKAIQIGINFALKSNFNPKNNLQRTRHSHTRHSPPLPFSFISSFSPEIIIF